MKKYLVALLFCGMAAPHGAVCGSCPPAKPAAADSIPEDTLSFGETKLGEAVVGQRVRGTRKSLLLPTNTELIAKTELLRAACCNLGESFVTNASVDVNYSDAATGARQIRLLGLSGTYVQMLTENIPNLRGAATPFGLGFIPGTWMQSIQVSKGASSVKNGYEAITGQINVEFLKPQAEESFTANAYADLQGKAELNAAGNVHLNKRWSTGLLLHAENGFLSHDSNGDGFADLPRIRQFAGMNRWTCTGEKYMFQAGVRFLAEGRLSGQDTHHNAPAAAAHTPYVIEIDTRRWELFAKNALFLNTENQENVALILSAALHDQDAAYGHKCYDVSQDNLYASLIYERKWRDGLHGLSAGLSLNHDRFDERFRFVNDASLQPVRQTEKETTPGAYAQYTLDFGSSLILMGGFRYDRSSVYGSMFTPRFHAKWNLLDGALSLHASLGRGYRSPRVLAENHFYMASSRRIIAASPLRQESAMNYGGGLFGSVGLFGRPLSYNAEVYFTRFSHQMLIDLDADPHAVVIKDSARRPSFSRAFQIELSCPVVSDFTLTAAYRYTDVRADYGRGLEEKPLTSRHKGLFSASWTPMMGKWQVDATLALCGGGRMPAPYVLDSGLLSWNARYGAFPQLNAQITRNFRKWSVYVGGENLTGYRQQTPVVGSDDPWGSRFDATMIYAPVHGAMAYVGFRCNLKRY
ncbi:MAG: TonB-dependent receptor [Prevotellaceae bacterium]|nr:TonB-dependent receptor [Prevotellaceae bacterium]